MFGTSQTKVHQQHPPSNNQSRNVICYNPLYSKNVKTNVRKALFKLIRKYFGRNYRFFEIFNMNNTKANYNYMDNLTWIVNAQNETKKSKTNKSKERLSD